MRATKMKTVRARVKVWQGARWPCFSAIAGCPPMGEIEFASSESVEQPQRGPHGTIVIDLGDHAYPVPLEAPPALKFAKAEMLGMKYFPAGPPAPAPAHPSDAGYGTWEGGVP